MTKILVTGGSGFVGKNFVSLLKERGAEVVAPTRKEYDLEQPEQVRAMFRELQPETVFHFAGYVGGIGANRAYPSDFCYRNLVISTHLLEEARLAGVKKFIGLIGGCSYPAHAPNPIKETELFNGYPQGESAPYSLAKAMMVVHAQSARKQYGFDAIVLVPGNIYGPHDNFDLQNSHVIPALIRKYLEAAERGDQEVMAWGTGNPVRDFVYIGDVCEAILLAAEKYSEPDIINISSGQPVTIRELTEQVAEVTGFRGAVNWDTTKPDGQMLKGFDVTRMRERLGFECKTTLKEGLQKTVAWFRENRDQARLQG